MLAVLGTPGRLCPADLVASCGWVLVNDTVLVSYVLQSLEESCMSIRGADSLFLGYCHNRHSLTRV